MLPLHVSPVAPCRWRRCLTGFEGLEAEDRWQIFEFFDPDRIVSFLIAYAEISCQSTFATFPSPRFPRATATLPQHGIAQFHVLCI